MPSENDPLLPIASPTPRGIPKLPSSLAIHPQASLFHRTTFEEGGIDPERHRKHSVSAADFRHYNVAKPLYQRLLANSVTVANASSQFEFGDTASIQSEEEHQRRLSVLNVLRPQKLIGNFQKPDWASSFVETSKVASKPLRKYYEDQNQLIERFSEIDRFLDFGRIHFNMLSTYGNNNVEVLPTHMEEPASPESPNAKLPSRHNLLPGNINEGAQFLGYDEQKDSQEVVFAILVNFFINFLLLVGKIVVSLLTNSISVVASLVDLILDFLSTFIIYTANKLLSSKNWRTQHAYPIGRSRLEPLGVLIFSIIIIISFVQVGQESFKRLFVAEEERKVVRIGTDAIAIMSVTIVSKIACWVWCSKSKSSSVQALAQDAETDVVFNTVSLLMPTFGYFFDIWWLDPLGALLLSIYVIVSWAKTAFEHIDNLTGAVADALDYKVVLYLAYRFAESIKQITALKVYHAGDNLTVEIDLVFNEEDLHLSFKDCHDIAEALQYAIETLPMVERAFVHIDYMEGNFKGHLR